MKLYGVKFLLFEHHSIHDLESDTLDIALADEYKPEYIWHSVIIAKYIGKLLLLLISHFEHNHPMQFYYLSHLIFDANGGLVLLKYINQSLFDQIDFESLLKGECLSLMEQ